MHTNSAQTLAPAGMPLTESQNILRGGGAIDSRAHGLCRVSFRITECLVGGGGGGGGGGNSTCNLGVSGGMPP